MPGVLAWTQPPAPHCRSQAPRRPRRGPTRREGRVTAPSDEEDTQGPCPALQARGPERPTEAGTSRTGQGVPWSSLVTATLVQVPESEVTPPGREGRGGRASTKDRGHSASCSETAVGATPPKPGGCCRWAGVGEEEARTVTSPALSRPHVDRGTFLGHCEAGGLPPGDPVVSQEPHPGPHCPGPRAGLCCQLASYKAQEYSTCSPPAARVSHVWPRPHKVGEPCLEEGSLQTSSS